MALAKKRAHKTLTLHEKVKILDALRKGKSGKELAFQYGVGASTICDIRRKSEIIGKYVASNHIS